MKTLIYIFSSLMLLSFSTTVWGQAISCDQSALSPFCSGIAQYAGNFDGTGAGNGPQAPTGPNYDCLGTQGNPTYFSLTINQSGTINFTLDNTANVDIDFILWGPFANVSAAQQACDSMGTGGVWGNVTDCSFSGNAQEPVSIPGAVAGQVYILMVTNFANIATNIFSTANTGSGTVSCPCDIPYTVDTVSAALGNQGYVVDTLNGVAKFLVCPNNSLAFTASMSGNINDTLGLYGPFTTVSTVFANSNVFEIWPNLPVRDTMDLATILTPDLSNIGVNNFGLGVINKINTGGLTDSSCFDQFQMQVIVPGVQVNDRNICSGETFTVSIDSIPTTSLGASSYQWTQLSGTTVSFSSTTAQNPTISVPVLSSTSTADSIVIKVDYQYGTLCSMSDTMVLRFPDVTIAMGATPDSVCIGQTSTLSAVLSDTVAPGICDQYNVNTITFGPLSGTGTTVTLGDDDVSNALPIGFNFNFYCNNYSQFYISSNGFITFNAGSDDGCCSGENVPDPGLFGGANNLIALCWTDNDPTSGGTIEYFTVGTAPNRQLVVNFNAVSQYTLGAAAQTVQAILYEGTNIIDIHVTNAEPSGGAGGFSALTIGLENDGGTIAHTPVGTNATNTVITNTAYRFAPFTNIPDYVWSPGGSTLANPLVTVNATTTYTANITDGDCIYEDTIRVVGISSYPAPTVACDSANFTSISVSWSNIGLPATGFYEYSTDGGTTWTSVGTALNATISGLNPNSPYTILIRGNDGTSGACVLSAVGTTNCSTLNPDCAGVAPVTISFNPTDVGCNGDSTGCIVATITGGTGNPMNLAWSNGATNIDSICSIPAGAYTLVVTDTFSVGGGSGNTFVYQEDFDATHNWNLNVSTGTNGTENNFWVVNNNEAGQAVGTCGAAGGTNQSLHITSNFNPTGGAAYDAGGLCGILPPPLGACPETNMRAESPSFSTVGQSGLTFEFNYIANGDGLNDNTSVLYNDGTGWQQLTASIKSPICPTGQGQWAKYTATLPASCDNNPTVQVGINWTNNDDAIGTDPSVAIDSIAVFASNSGTLVSCVDSASVTINEPTALVASVDSFSNPLCSGSADGSVSISVTGGTTNYSFLWSDGSTNEDATGMNNGLQTVTVTDGNGCTDTTQQTLSVPNPIIVSSSTVDNSCAGTADGSIDVTVSGGAGGFTFAWSNGVTTEDLTAASNGNYSLTITDANGCSETVQAVISPTVFLSSTDAVTNPLCFGGVGSATITVLGGSGSYGFDWGASSSSTTNTATGLVAGPYVVTITDNVNSCTTTDTVTLVGPAVALSVTLTTANIACNGAASSGGISTATTGGTSPYTYAWSNGTTNSNANGLSANTYTVTVTDFNSCVATNTATVTQDTAVVASINTTAGMLGCDLSATGALQAVGTGGSNFTYAWSNGTTDMDATGLAAASYTVTVTNDDGCTDTASATIMAPAVPTLAAYVGAIGQERDTISPNSSTTINANGGTGQTYAWVGSGVGNPGIATPNAAISTVAPDQQGDYIYIVTSTVTTNGLTCTTTDSVYVTVEPDYIGMPNAFTPDGANKIFRPVTLDASAIVTFRIYNRFGQMVYNGDDLPNGGWDGTYNGVAQPRDVYIYVLEYKRPSDTEAKMLRGECTLLR